MPCLAGSLLRAPQKREHQRRSQDGWVPARPSVAGSMAPQKAPRGSEKSRSQFSMASLERTRSRGSVGLLLFIAFSETCHARHSLATQQGGAAPPCLAAARRARCSSFLNWRVPPCLTFSAFLTFALSRSGAAVAPATARLSPTGPRQAKLEALHPRPGRACARRQPLASRRFPSSLQLPNALRTPDTADPAPA